MAKTSKTDNIVENLFYYISVILTLGTTWLVKVVFKKAFYEALRDSNNIQE